MRSELSVESFSWAAAAVPCFLRPALLHLSCHTRRTVPFDVPEGTVRKFHQSFWLNEQSSDRNRSNGFTAS